mgnify:CR=1 FL=1
MAITRVKNYNIAPYYDDFDESKNYHRIMFRPGFAVQARELTQLQTALQSQIDKLGQYNFNDGSRVVGGKVTVNTEYDFVKLTSTSNVSQFVGTTITGGTNGVTAKVLEAVAATGSDPDTLYIEYNGSGTANATKLFANGESITNGSKTATLASSSATGKGSRVSIEEGAYFISGTMVYVAPASLILDKYTNTPSYIIGLNVTETSNVDNATDTTLVDNAQGTPNYAAPGAHRYKISTELIKESLSSPNATYANYIMLMKINSGVVQVKTEDKTANTELTSRLARRTHEESGNYSVRPFSLDIREHLDNTAGNGGWKTSGNGGSALKLAVGVEPSVCYVQGYRLENLATNYVEIDKPRDLQNENAKTTSLPVGNYVQVTLSTVRGMPNINDLQTCTLADGGGNIGTARIRGFEQATATVWNLYLFDIQMNSGETFGTVTTITQTNSSGQDFTATLATTGARYDVGNDGLVFKLPYDGIKTLNASSPVDHPDYIVRHRVQGQISGTGNSATISFTSLPGTVNSKADVMIAVGNNAAQLVPQACITSNTGATTLTIANTSNALSTIGSGTPHVQVVVSLKKVASGGRKSKTYTVQSATNYSFNGSDPVMLNRSDVVRINTLTIGGVDHKENFILDTGQRDNFYDEARLIPKGTQAAATLSVQLDYFEHGSGDYFTVDSYEATYTDGASVSRNGYEEIPTFESNKGTVELRDCIDFRPTKASSGSPTSGFEFTTGTGDQIADTPQPGSVMTADIQHYLGRIDKLYVDREGTFRVIKGVADNNPKPPEDINDSMTIFELHCQPYIFEPADCIPVKIDNKRYTMRDIGAIDSRLKNVEYYTSLSLLEKEAASVQIQDGSNNERMKNGIVVDGFYGHNVGNITHPDYHCSIDKTPGVLRPMFYEDNVNLVGSSIPSGWKTGSLIHLPFSEVTYIEQPYATMQEFVNPYNVFTWGGEMKLSPESDEWKDTDTRPDVVIDNEGVYDQLVHMAEENGILGTVWNEWETNWTGTEITESTSTMDVEEEGEGWFRRRFRRRRGAATTTTVATTTTSNQSRSGLKTTVVPDTQLKELGSRVVETNFIPFMRSREIFFHAERMKPNTKVYAFFNGSDVTNYCSETGGYKEWSNESSIASFKDATVHANNTDLITDASGQVAGSFRIPHNSSLKFKTGTREFRLSDDSTNNKDNETTFAEALYHAQGLLETKENVIMSTKVPRFVSTELGDTRVVQETSITRFTDPVEWVDPVAQTFIVDTVGGIFASSCEIYIAAEDASIPINLSIRSVENGIPTQQVVPGTSVNMYPSSITTSTNGSVATKFTFDHPVYLGQDQEYAIVLISQSDDYKVFIAETGGFDLANPTSRVTKQPYNGVFFTSANSSTWTPEQTRDMKFKLNRCNFTTTSGNISLVNDVVPTASLPANPFTYVSNSTNTIIRVQHPNHGMHGSSKVTISGQSGTVNGITAAQMNTTHTVSEAEIDSYTITLSGIAATTAGGLVGGGAGIKATCNKMYDVLKPTIQTLEVPRTAINLTLSATTGQSIDQVGQAANNITGIGGILANQNNEFTSPMQVMSAVNETNYNSGNKSLQITAALVGNSYLTPIIDMNRASVICVSNRLNDAGNNSSDYNDTANGRTYVAETSATGGSELNSYVTKRIDLNNEADILDVYLNVNKPNGAAIDLYYKAIAAGSDLDFESQPWILDAPEKTIPDNDGGAYSEAHYIIDPTIGKFGSFAFKIVLRGNNSSYAPTVKDFRAIAAL